MSTALEVAPSEEDQFDDALEDGVVIAVNHETIPTPDPRSGHSYIDEANVLEWSSSGSEEEELDEFEAEEDLMEVAAFDGLRAEDEDWEIAERGTTSHSILAVDQQLNVR